MSQNTLLMSAAGSLVSALLYLYVGQVLRRRKVSSEAKLAQGMFILWWESIGWLGILGVAVMLVYMVQGSLPVWLFQTYLLFVLLVLFVALWGLQFYLVYLYTGSKRSFLPLGIFYTLLFVGTAGLIEYQGTPGYIGDDGWQLKACSAASKAACIPGTQLGLWAGLAFVILLVGPQVVAAAAYARLYRKTSDPTQRYRIALIASAIIVWFGSSILGTAAGVSTSLTWQLISRVIGILGALVILVAYLPPAWVREKYHIRSIRDEVAPGAGLG